MAGTDIGQQTRAKLEQFRHDTARRSEAAHAARRRLEHESAAADRAEQAAVAAAHRQRAAAIEAGADRREADGIAAGKALNEARRRAANAAEAIRGYWNGADTALGLADLRSLEDAAQTRVAPVAAAPSRANASRELSRCVMEAGKAAKRIDGNVQQLLNERGKRRSRTPLLFLAALLVAASSVVAVQQLSRPCRPLHGFLGSHASCPPRSSHHAGVDATPGDKRLIALEMHERPLDGRAATDSDAQASFRG